MVCPPKWRNFIYTLFIFSLSIRPFFSLAGLSIPPSYVLAPVVLAVLAGDFSVKKKHLYILVLLFSFFIFQSFTIIWSYDQAASIKYSFHIPFLMTIAIIAASMFRDIERIKDFLCHFLYIFAIISVIMFAGHLYVAIMSYGSEGDFVLFSLVEKGIYRYVGLNSDPNFEGFFILLFIGACLWIKPRFYFAIFIFLSMTLIATLSRSAIGTYLLCLFIWSVYRKKLIYLALMTSGIVFVYTLRDSSIYVERRLSGIDSGAGRLALWHDSIHMFNNSPVFGNGLGSYLYMLHSSGQGTHFVHNTFISVAISSGIIGLTLFLIPFFVIIIKYKFLILTNPLSLFVLFSILGTSLTLSAFINPFLYFSISLLACSCGSGVFLSKHGSCLESRYS